MSREELERAVRSAAVNNRLSCAAAHRLAEECKATLGDIGAICNELKIKITECGLGCFEPCPEAGVGSRSPGWKQVERFFPAAFER